MVVVVTDRQWQALGDATGLAPRLGEHTVEVLGERLGYSMKKIAGLLEDGIAAA